MPARILAVKYNEKRDPATSVRDAGKRVGTQSLKSLYCHTTGLALSAMKNVYKLLLVLAILAPLISPVSRSVYAQPFTDPTNDLFDKNGNPIQAESYLDIVSIDVKRSDENYIITLVVNGELPEKVDPSIWIEWEMVLDADNNPSTGWNWPVGFNDLGVDYLIRTGILDSTYYPGIWRTQPKFEQVASPYLDIKNNTVTLTVVPSDKFHLPSAMNWMATVEKYGKRGQPPNPPLLAADKAPNQGHFSTTLESIATVASTTATTLATSYTSQVTTTATQVVTVTATVTTTKIETTPAPDYAVMSLPLLIAAIAVIAVLAVLVLRKRK